tara:strand:- start:78 stop:1130 length:1053 start_codon:yes stop_codon:yes gene_type:complete
MELSNIIFLFFLLFLGYLFNFLLLNFKRRNFDFLLDNQFNKPQAFHDQSTYRTGGLLIYFLLVFTFLYFFFYKNIFLIEYISFCTLFFLLGLIDDLKINIRPKFRLIIMVSLLVTLILQNELYIEKTGLEFLNYLLKIDIFALFFICLCFLFIINGSNLIDGFNGLLGIHSLIIFIILFIINLNNTSNDFSYFLFCLCFIILIFLKFNFPQAKIFLGDSGAYIIGTLIAISVVKTSILNSSIHPFFFCILLFYLFFEVFFSFLRKIFFSKQNPLFPDSKHLHMSLYKILLKKNENKLNSNYKVSLYINLIYLSLITPAIFLMENGLFCRYYFFFLLLAYIYFYRILYKKL